MTGKNVFLIACIGALKCNVGDDLKGIGLPARLGEGGFVALSLAAVGSVGIGRVLQGVR